MTKDDELPDDEATEQLIEMRKEIQELNDKNREEKSDENNKEAVTNEELVESVKWN